MTTHKLPLILILFFDTGFQKKATNDFRSPLNLLKLLIHCQNQLYNLLVCRLFIDMIHRFIFCTANHGPSWTTGKRAGKLSYTGCKNCGLGGERKP